MKLTLLIIGIILSGCVLNTRHFYDRYFIVNEINCHEDNWCTYTLQSYRIKTNEVAEHDWITISKIYGTFIIGDTVRMVK